MEAARATTAHLARSAFHPHHRSHPRTARFPPSSPQVTLSPRCALLRRRGARVNCSKAPAGSQGEASGCDMGEYYRHMLHVYPGNPLLLRNYGKYLHEVEGDVAAAEGCYARALLACPGDADLLSLYGRVIWEARQEKDRATEYFQRAVQAAPDDCYVLASYVSFLWEADDDDGQRCERANNKCVV